MAKEKEQKSEEKKSLAEKTTISRRTILKALAGLPVFGIFAYKVIEKRSSDQYKKRQVLEELCINEIKAPE